MGIEPTTVSAVGSSTGDLFNHYTSQAQSLLILVYSKCLVWTMDVIKKSFVIKKAVGSYSKLTVKYIPYSVLINKAS